MGEHIACTYCRDANGKLAYTQTKDGLEDLRVHVAPQSNPALGNVKEVKMASEAIVGTDSIVGFDVNGDRERGSGLRALHTTIDRGEQTRDILQATRFEGEHLRDAIFDNGVAIEKNGMSNLLATEKIGAATALAVEKIGAATQLQSAQLAASAQLFAAQNHAAALAQAAECCCETKELIREEAGRTRDLINTIESNRVRDALADAKSEILALRLGANGPGNSVRA